jgi:quercetin dioxygenase-like cupin family protein
MTNRSHVVALAIAIVAANVLPGVHAQELPTLRKMSENKFAPVPGLPSCAQGAVQSGDPAKGPSIILFKASAGCRIPWHWHTAVENVMLVSGSVKIESNNGKPAVIGPGGYAMLPGKHVHQFTCTSPCSGFVASDSAFDIHYVDSGGKEIPADVALGKRR